MQKRCNRCFELYEKNDGICPFCGHSETVKVQSSHVLQPGTQLKGGRFIIGEQIGQGSVGIVYKAWDNRLDRTIVIKEFFPDSLATRAEGMMSVMVYSTQDVNEYEKCLRTFKREAMIMSLVADSGNCLKAFDIFEENGTAYITMEYCDSPKLSDYLKNHNRTALTEDEVNAIMMQLLQGVSELHEKGIYHLNLSPDKIFIRKNDDRFEVKIFSFDTAVLKKDIKRGIEIEKMPYSGFRAPELVGQTGRIGPWTDVYALGAIYYYLLTGSVPKPAAKEENAAVPEWLSGVLTQALAVVGEQRFTDAGELREVLAYRREREEKEQVEQEESETPQTGGKHTFLVIVLVLIAVMAVGAVGAVLYTLASKAKTEITVWVTADTDAESEKNRYESVILAFEEVNPDIIVHLEVMDSNTLVERLLSAGKQELPDMAETTGFSGRTLSGFEPLSELAENLSGTWVADRCTGFESMDRRQIPLGFYTTVRYRRLDVAAEEAQAGSVDEFVRGDAGYVDSDTTIYSMIQKNLPGRYEVTEAEEREVYFVEVFSITAKTQRKENASKEFLNYMMSDEAQEIIHMTYPSECFPITTSMFEVYVGDVFTELQFLKDTIQEYEIIQ